MSSCCTPTAERLATKGALTIALAGNPNSGKTTIFNALTGLRQKVANYPGVTVEKKTGRCKLGDGRWIDVIDLPGTYSLISRSPDELVAMEVLRGLRKDTPAPDVVVIVVDASNLQRNLYLVSQLIELGRPMVVALNMMDVAERRGLHLSPESLARGLGVPVVPVVGHKHKGIAELKDAITRAAVAPLPKWPLPDAMREELLLVGGGLAILDSGEESGFEEAGEGSGFRVQGSGGGRKDAAGAGPAAPAPHTLLSTQNPGLGGASRLRIGDSALPGASHLHRSRLEHYQAVAERLLIGDRAGDVAPIANRQPVSTLLNSAATRLSALGIDPMQADIEAHYHWIDEVAAGALVPACAALTAAPLADPGAAPSRSTTTLDYATPPAKNFTQKLDAILIHKIWGLAIFGLIMTALFVSVFFVADPLMGAIEKAVEWLGKVATAKLADGPFKDMIVDGIFAGVGAVVVFVPQIAILFLFLAVMEDSGYLARAAFLMDKLLSKVGLHGKSFIPMLSSFACAIPGIMATRTIENRKDRLATIFVAPFMSCSARLPVYFLLIGTFFASYGPFARGGIMFALYALGVIAAAFTAFLFKRTLLKGPTPAFILEMPTYKLPQITQIGRQVWTNTAKFLTKAGTIIFCLSIILWAMTYYPRLSPESVAQIEQQAAETFVLEETLTLTDDQIAELKQGHTDKAVESAQLRHSLAGRLGHFMEPAIRPLGYDWKMGVGLVGAFAAREVFVSTMAITYNAGSDEETQSLSEAMLADRHPDGSPVWTPLVAASLLVWFVLAMQCMSTLAIVRRETNSWRWPIFMLLYMNALAYVLSLAVYQVGKLFV